MASKTKLHFAVTLAVMVFIFIQSALPGSVSGTESNLVVRFISWITGMDPEPLRLMVRKTAHFVEFLLLGICLAVSTKDWERDHDKAFPEKHLMLCAWLIGTMYAVTDEIHQAFVPERACSIIDVGIDSAGVVIGVMIAGMIGRRKKGERTDLL